LDELEERDLRSEVDVLLGYVIHETVDTVVLAFIYRLSLTVCAKWIDGRAPGIPTDEAGQP
jgi:hypothetical protein